MANKQSQPSIGATVKSVKSVQNGELNDSEILSGPALVTFSLLDMEIGKNDDIRPEEINELPGKAILREARTNQYPQLEKLSTYGCLQSKGVWNFST